MSGDNHNQPVRRMSDDEARMFVAPPAQETWTEVSGPNHNQADPACDRAPRGWRCFKPLDHDGPCPAWPTRATRIRYALLGRRLPR